MKIYFNSKNVKDSIRFDHKDENVKININPTAWLKRNRFNLKNRTVWESCKFGMLCNKCNLILPTKNRKEFIVRLNKYASQ